MPKGIEKSKGGKKKPKYSIKQKRLMKKEKRSHKTPDVVM